MQQNILRAEITAALSAISWAAAHSGDLHLWVDNQTLVDHLRELQLKTGNVKDFEHSDLWIEIEKVMAVAVADIFCPQSG